MIAQGLQDLVASTRLVDATAGEWNTRHGGIPQTLAQDEARADYVSAIYSFACWLAGRTL